MYAPRETGQELVEFAILVPVLILIALGLLDLGRVYFSAITITNAARVGARYGMAYPNDTNGIIAATQAEAQGSGIDLTNASISSIDVLCPEGCDSNRPVRVTVTYRFTLVTGFVLPDSEITLVQSAEMLVP